MITAEQLRNAFDYSEETGLFTRKNLAPRSKRWKTGQIAGNIHKHSGYWVIGFNGKSHLYHRLVWLYVTGEWPSKDIDHKDGDITNNKFSNLRLITEVHNAQNQRRAHKGSKSGILGVYPKGNRWMSTICVDKVPKYLGTFASKEEAFAAYLSAKRKFHPGSVL